MTLRTNTVTITAEGRDKGKRFLITEMPASKGEEWAIRAMGAASKSGVDIPDSIVAAGWAAVAFMGMRAILAAPWPDVKPLLDEMMSCIKSIQDAAPEGRMLVESDIEEITTRAFLRDEVFKLHANFSMIDMMSRVIETLRATPDDSPDTPASPEQSE